MINLKTIQGVEILTVIDNYMDVFLPSTDEVRRLPLFEEDHLAPPVLAEHGLCLFITIYDGPKKHCLLLDAGFTAVGCIYNMDVMNLPMDRVGAFVLSHGHFDHVGALYELYSKNYLNKGTPLHLHSKAFSGRGLKDPSGGLHRLPQISESSLKDKGAEIIIEDGPSLILDQTCLLTGEIPRRSFEIGFPIGWRKEKDMVIRDDIPDDQALIFYIKGKGLVVVLGCGHSGVINTLNYAKELTGCNEIYMVFGGFHLSGEIFERYTDQTIDELIAMAPKMIVPTHCTGFNSIRKFAERMTDSFVMNSVGTTYRIFS
ncbi:MAG: MBL fold metallo-hydrolase [Desulfobacteraceae bacterium]|nr:MBL fold metallo-hydrolase [Desulfobacteraceae bacterium]